MYNNVEHTPVSSDKKRRVPLFRRSSKTSCDGLGNAVVCDTGCPLTGMPIPPATRSCTVNTTLLVCCAISVSLMFYFVSCGEGVQARQKMTESVDTRVRPRDDAWVAFACPDLWKSTYRNAPKWATYVREDTYLGDGL